MKRYLIVLAACLLFIGCNQTEDLPLEDKVIRVEALLPQQSRATLSAFEQGDQMGLYAVSYNEDGTVAPVQVSGNYLNNELMTYDGAKWASTRTLYWSQADCDFYGIYPYQTLTSIDEQLFEVATDQSTEETSEAIGGYEASDLMWAKAEKVSPNTTVKLSFEHLMSRLVVKLVKGSRFEGDLPENIVTHIYNTATTAKVNYQQGSLEKYVYSDHKTIKMRQMERNDDEATFEAIVVPQLIERTTPLVEITMGGIAYLLNYSMSFRPGFQHTITVTLNTSPDQEKVEIQLEGDVSDWN